MTIWTDPTQVPADTIVVGWDGSRDSTSALEWAVDNASGEKRPITVVQAMPLPVAVRANAEELQHVGADLLAEAKAIQERHGGHTELHVLVTPGEARLVLADLSRKATMVVIGSHGRGPIGSKLMGSVGVAVVRDASCPVVVIRPQRSGTVGKGVLVGIDVDESAARVAAFAFHRASVLDLPLAIVHTVPTGSSRVIVDNAKRHVSELLAGLREQHPDVHCTSSVVPGDTDDVMLEQARGRHLVVLGAPRTTGRIMTTTASRLIEHAAVPVAVVPLDTSGDRATSDGARRKASVGDT